MLGHRMSRVLVRSVTGCHDCSYDRSPDATINFSYHRSPVIPLSVRRSLIANTSHTISYDGSCHRYSPIVCDSATTCRDRSRYATAAGDRSKHCRSIAPWPNRNQSYNPEIVRSGVTVALLYCKYFVFMLHCLHSTNTSPVTRLATLLNN